MRVIDLFAGCGGLSLGFQNAGFDIVAAYDNWQPAVGMYQQNFEHPIFDLDIASPTLHKHLEGFDAEMIIGGPPCQDFSSAGKRQEQTRADLTLRFANIIHTLRPRVFVMENVERITTTQTLAQAVAIFRTAGYGLTARVLNASLCGVPQLRKRFFLIGVLGEPSQALMPYLENNLATTPMTVYDYLGHSLGTEHYYRHPRSYARRAVFSIHEPSPTIRGVNRPVPKTYQFHEGDTLKDLHQLRPLTTLERSYLQTFPKGFEWCNYSKSDTEQAIGNAVPVKLAEYVATSIAHYLQDTVDGTYLQPNYSLFATA